MPRLAGSRDESAAGLTRLSDLSGLKRRWQVLCNALKCPEQAAAGAWQVIEQHYSEPHRHYHTLAHVAALLRHADAYREHLTRTSVVELAIWFHDIIYDTHTSGNEAASAALALTIMRTMQVDDGIAGQVERCILATADHAIAEADANLPDLAPFLDFDLAILGAPRDIYQCYGEAIRREYGWVADQDYRAGRARVLRRFLDRPALYFTPWMAARFEASARDNIKSELLLLEPQSTPGND